ncbi:hypothetical protein GALL_331600 [mine drainage metagenome]|jgi:hypothetical protein|uniref:Lipoprotein n=1 Tax=mine drainage metagenome TaxID=410659 RepID=A0A1J5QYU1_9ZZZZ
MTRLFAATAFTLLLAACSSPSPMLDASFGAAVRQNKQAQFVHPQPAAAASVAAGLDGTAARAAVQRYDKTFTTPPRTLNVINIGGSIAGSTSGTGASAGAQ